jgi:AcrR family transcriptional regulator
MERTVRTDMRDLILDATERLMARYGYKKMTMDDLAAEAGVAKRTIYLHFKNKEDVALCSIDRVVARLLDRLRQLACADQPADERVRRMLMTRVLFRFDSVQGYYQSFDDLFAALRPAYMARRSRYFEAEAEVFAEVLAEGVKQGALQTTEPFATARTLLRATNSLLPYSLSRQELGKRSEIEKRVGEIADVLLDGLRARTAESPRNETIPPRTDGVVRGYWCRVEKGVD